MFLLSSYSMLQDILPVVNQTNAIYSRLTIIVKTDYSATPTRVERLLGNSPPIGFCLRSQLNEISCRES
jgi:hypothetical protein